MKRLLLALGLGALIGLLALVSVELYLLDVWRHPPVPPVSSPFTPPRPGRPRPAAASRLAPRPAEPTPAPAEPVQPQAAAERGPVQAAPLGVIPGLDVEALQGTLRSLGFECRPGVIVGRALVWGCEGVTEAGALLSVHAEGLGLDEVRVVRASIQQPGPVSEFVSARFLGAVASVPYSGAEPQRAEQWVASELLAGGHARMGRVHFQVGGVPRLRTLDIWGDGP